MPNVIYPNLVEISTRSTRARVCVLSTRSDMITWSRRCTWLSNGLCTDSVTWKTRKCNCMKMSSSLTRSTRFGQTTNPNDDESYLIPSCIIWDTLWEQRRETDVNVWLTFLLPILLGSFLLLFFNNDRSVCLSVRKRTEKKKKGEGGRRMTWPVDWRGGKENGHFTFSDHSQKETASNWKSSPNQTRQTEKKEGSTTRRRRRGGGEDDNDLLLLCCQNISKD